MKSLCVIGVASVFLAVVMMVAAAVPVSAVDRQSGEYWTYDVMIDVFGVSLNGTVKFVCEGEDALILNGTSYEVNVMKISGSVEGSTSFPGFDVRVAADIEGHSYETAEGMATVKDDVLLKSKISMTMGTLTVTSKYDEETIATYLPPLMSQFDPNRTGPGDSWTETIVTNITTKTWANGTQTGSDTSSDTMTYSVDVASSLQTITVPAGTFETLRITMTDEYGDYEVYYWSSEVKNYVMQESFNLGYVEPYESMSLSKYGTSGSVGILIVVLAVVALIVIALILFAVMRSRRPRQPMYQYVQPPMPPSPPT